MATKTSPNIYRGVLDEADIVQLYAGTRTSAQTIDMSMEYFVKGRTLTEIAEKHATTRQNSYQRIKVAVERARMLNVKWLNAAQEQLRA